MPDLKVAAPLRGEMVWVLWVDAVAEDNSSWTRRDHFTPREEGGLMCESVGFLYHKDERSIVLIQSFNEGAMDHLLTIPRGMVRDMRALRVGRKRNGEGV